MSQGIVNQILHAEDVYQSANSKRIEALARLRGMNVAFADIKERLLREARVEGYYSTKDELKQAIKNKVNWCYQLHRFTDWVYKTYSNYDIIKKSDPKRLQGKPSKEREVRVNQKAITPERVQKLVENPENVQVISEGLESKGIVLVHRTLTPAEAETILGDDENIDLLLQLLSDRGLIPTCLAA
jgi:hypothetical protein